jgi:lambda family phage portal protein
MRQVMHAIKGAFGSIITPLRAIGKSAAAIVNKYDAAGNGRRLRGWNPPASGPNRAIEGLAVIRNRARDALRNEWTGSAGSRVWTTNLIGTGIIPRPNTTDIALKARLIALWNAWAPLADADGVLDFYGLQTLATRNWIASGEIFVRLRARRVEDGLPVPLQIQLMEADMVPLLDTDAWPGMPAGNRIRSGIELDRVGRRIAYWMYREHPGDKQGAASAGQLTRIPAEFIRHIYEPLRPGQMRGVSDFASILVKLRGVMDFDDAVLERQKLANLFTLFITRGNVGGDPNIDPISGQPISSFDHDGAPLAALEPGLSQELLPGEDVKFSDPPDAGANYADFMRQQHLGVSAGNGLPYELLTGDIKDVSDRTLRVVITEFRRHCEQRQWQVIIPMLCQPIRDAWADAAGLAGHLTAGEALEARRVTWQPQGWAYIHPVQDVQGKKLEVEAGFRSRASVISERGDDPDSVDAERAADILREKSHGLAPDPVPAAPATDPATAKGLSDIRVSMEALRLSADRRPAEPQPPANITINQGDIHLPAPQNTINLPELSPTFEATIQAAPAPEVTVNNQVQPTPVEIHNAVQPAVISEISIVSMPTRETTTEIVRDTGNNIITTTQTETDREPNA